jgi:hypothetical protein
MSENNEQAGSIENDELDVTGTGAEDVKPAEVVTESSGEVVTESAGEMVDEEQPILKEKKEKKVKSEARAAAACGITGGI